MIENERHRQILQILNEEGYIDVKSLSKMLYVSCPTIRRDLSYLENQGYIRRNHGGALLVEDKLHNNPIGFRRAVKTKEKSKICQLASTLVTNGSLVFIDDSTTAYHLANFLKNIENITVVTNGLSICNLLSSNNIDTISTGGRLIKKSQAFVGYFAEQTVLNFNADIMFFSAAALDENGIISDYSEEETVLRHAMYKRSNKTVFLCDSDKFNTVSELRFHSLKDIDYVVTDDDLPEKVLDLCNLKEFSRIDGAILYSHIPNE